MPLLFTWMVAIMSMEGERESPTAAVGTRQLSSALPVTTSHTRMERSMEAESSRRPSELKSMAVIRSEWPRNLRTRRGAAVSNTRMQWSSQATAARSGAGREEMREEGGE